MENTNTLSVIIITRNEEDALPGCLDSIKTIADQIVLVDSGSTDGTLSIAKKYTTNIFHRDWTGYSAQKQFALEQATRPWILNIDADEQVTPALAEEIRQLLQSNPVSNGYDIPFKHFFCGKLLRFGASRGESHVRLFKKAHSSYGSESVHEGVQVEGPVGRLKNSILHFSYKDIHDYLTKCNDYTSLIAREKFAKGARYHFWQVLRLPWEFLVRYVLKLGFLDGGKGLTYALLSSHYVWLKYAKLKDYEGRKK